MGLFDVLILTRAPISPSNSSKGDNGSNAMWDSLFIRVRTRKTDGSNDFGESSSGKKGDYFFS
jgi:hypothetical protein